MKPFDWFTPKISDTEYAPKFQAVLHTIKPYFDIIHDAPKMDGTDDWEPIMAWYAQRLTDHLAGLTQAHNALVDVKPRRQLMGLHRGLVKVAKTYGWALKDRADADEAVLDDALYHRHSHHIKHGAQWDALTRRYSKDLVRHLDKLSASAPETYALIIGDDQLIEGLADFADDDISGGSIIHWGS